MSSGLLILVLVLYTALLFGIAYMAERKRERWGRLFNSPWVYSLSLGAYCTAWTFYGGVASVSTQSIDFLTVYLGPTLVMILSLTILHKVITIVQKYRITSLSDFISLRYGKSTSIGILVTIICLLATIPYVSLQIKALDGTFNFITQGRMHTYWIDPLVFFFIILLGFAVLFGTRTLDVSERHEGLIVAISFENVFKLVAILLAGIFILYASYDNYEGFVESSKRFFAQKNLLSLEGGSLKANWLWHISLSGFAFVLLPRQFQVGIIEAKTPKHLNNAIWVVPLYLFLINLLVIPLAITGFKVFGASWTQLEFGLLSLSQSTSLLLLIFLGGFSAAFGMIILESIAVSTMMTNSVLLPYWVNNEILRKAFKKEPIRLTKQLRRLVILAFLFLSFVYYLFISKADSFIFTGFSSFVGVAQVAPAFFLGIFWKEASAKGAFWGMLTGFVVYVFLLILPNFFQNTGWSLILPFYELSQVFSIADLDLISTTAFWSLSLNLLVFYVLSTHNKEHTDEVTQAILFVDVYKQKDHESISLWKGDAQVSVINELLGRFIGSQQVRKEYQVFLKNQEDLENKDITTARWFTKVENRLNGLIGSTASQILLGTVSKKEAISVDEVLKLLKETYDLKTLNKELDHRRIQLKALTNELAKSNSKLQKADQEKNEFLATVVHEIRSPMTSIQAIGEILADNNDLARDEQLNLLNTILSETNRLKNLVDQILELERYDKGKNKLELSQVNIVDLLNSVLAAYQGRIRQKGIRLETLFSSESTPIFLDEEKIKQVVHNLVSNALKFMSDDKGILRVAYNETSEVAQICIEDNGVGIPADHLESIFDKFYQSEATRSINTKGSGLGLSISKAIVSLHHGAISVSSRVGEGSKFTITLKKQGYE